MQSCPPNARSAAPPPSSSSASVSALSSSSDFSASPTLRWRLDRTRALSGGSSLCVERTQASQNQGSAEIPLFVAAWETPAHLEIRAVVRLNARDTEQKTSAHTTVLLAGLCGRKRFLCAVFVCAAQI